MLLLVAFGFGVGGGDATGGRRGRRRRGGRGGRMEGEEREVVQGEGGEDPIPVPHSEKEKEEREGKEKEEREEKEREGENENERDAEREREIEREREVERELDNEREREAGAERERSEEGGVRARVRDSDEAFDSRVQRMTRAGAQVCEVERVVVEGLRRTRREVVDAVLRRSGVLEAGDLHGVIVASHYVAGTLEGLGVFKEVNVWLEPAEGRRGGGGGGGGGNPPPSAAAAGPRPPLGGGRVEGACTVRVAVEEKPGALRRLKVGTYWQDGRGSVEGMARLLNATGRADSLEAHLAPVGFGHRHWSVGYEVPLVAVRGGGLGTRTTTVYGKSEDWVRHSSYARRDVGARRVLSLPAGEPGNPLPGAPATDIAWELVLRDVQTREPPGAQAWRRAKGPAAAAAASGARKTAAEDADGGVEEEEEGGGGRGGGAGAAEEAPRAREGSAAEPGDAAAERGIAQAELEGRRDVGLGGRRPGSVRARRIRAALGRARRGAAAHGAPPAVRGGRGQGVARGARGPRPRAPPRLPAGGRQRGGPCPL